jgi:hypothetical protein
LRRSAAPAKGSTGSYWQLAGTHEIVSVRFDYAHDVANLGEHGRLRDAA